MVGGKSDNGGFFEFNGKNPTLVDAYGGFEISMIPRYSGGVGVAWLEKGGVKVIANIRGGGEYGPRWHQAALRERRHRVNLCSFTTPPPPFLLFSLFLVLSPSAFLVPFRLHAFPSSLPPVLSFPKPSFLSLSHSGTNKAYEDMEAVAQDLIDRGVASPSSLACIGGSNGGLLVGNMITRPVGSTVFGAAVCQVRSHRSILPISSFSSFFFLSPVAFDLFPPLFSLFSVPSC